MKNIEIKDSFREDLTAIYQYVAEYFGASYIYKIEQKIEKKIFTLSVFPESGKSTNDRNFYYAICGRNKIFYKVMEGEVVFYRILDTRKLLPHKLTIRKKR